jgi:hypothetical protein
MTNSSQNFLRTFLTTFLQLLCLAWKRILCDCSFHWVTDKKSSLILIYFQMREYGVYCKRFVVVILLSQDNCKKFCECLHCLCFRSSVKIVQKTLREILKLWFLFFWTSLKFQFSSFHLLNCWLNCNLRSEVRFIQDKKNAFFSKQTLLNFDHKRFA